MRHIFYGDFAQAGLKTQLDPLIANIHQHAIVQALPGLGGCLSEAKAGGSYYSCKSEIN